MMPPPQDLLPSGKRRKFVWRDATDAELRE